MLGLGKFKGEKLPRCVWRCNTEVQVQILLGINTTYHEQLHLTHRKLTIHASAAADTATRYDLWTCG
jgi:hypothetical protein